MGQVYLYTIVFEYTILKNTEMNKAKNMRLISRAGWHVCMGHGLFMFLFSQMNAGRGCSKAGQERALLCMEQTIESCQLIVSTNLLLADLI